MPSLLNDRLLYILPLYHVHPGLEQKIYGQEYSFNKSFHTITYRFDRFLINNQRFLFLKFILFQFYLIFKFRSYSLFYVRYNPKFIFLNFFLSIFSLFKPVFIEINTNYKAELSFLNRKFELFCHQIQLFFLSLFPLHFFLVHKRDADYLLKKGVKSVTHLRNGYFSSHDFSFDTEDSTFDTLRSFKRQYPKSRFGIFVGSGASWHGVDLLIEFLNNHENLCIVLVGTYSNKRIESHSRLLHFPSLSLSSLCSIYELCDFGIGSLNWSSIGISEGTPLKTCEYLYFGLPILVNYHDWNLKDSIFKTAIYDLSCDDLALTKLLNRPLGKLKNLNLCRTCLSWDSRLISPMKAILNNL